MEIQQDVVSVTRIINYDCREHMDEKTLEEYELREQKWWNKQAKKENIKRNVNTGRPVFFETRDIVIDPDENPLHRVNEITLHGKGDVTLEFYENGNVKVLSTELQNLKRIYWNRITTNYMPHIKAEFNGRTKEGAIVMRICDSDYSLAGHPMQLVTLPFNKEGNDTERLMEPYLKAYTEERYGKNPSWAYQWTIEGSEIRFINKKNTGNLVIYNRSFHTREILTNQMSGYIKVPPYMKHNVHTGICKSCGK